VIVDLELKMPTSSNQYWIFRLGVRDRFRECGALGHLSFWGPTQCDLFDRLSGKRESMPLLCVVRPQKSMFCGSDFGSTIALDLNIN